LRPPACLSPRSIRLPPLEAGAIIVANQEGMCQASRVTEGRATLQNEESRDRSWLWARLRNDLLFFLIAVLVVALDQLTKYVIRSHLLPGETGIDWDFVRIIRVTNTGAAFGILQGQGVFLTITTLFGLAAIILYYLYPPMEHGLLRLALGLQLGGAVGNLTDRVRQGGVTDFIDFRYWPAFNVADSAIVVGVATVIGFFVLSETLWQREKMT
jgi:signal peptidase II